MYTIDATWGRILAACPGGAAAPRTTKVALDHWPFDAPIGKQDDSQGPATITCNQ